MIPYTRRAARQVDDLLTHFMELERPEAMSNLLAALRDASTQIENAPGSGVPAPRPYPFLARPGRFWIKSGRYWVGYRRNPTLAIFAVFYDAANIPGRL